ncbi:hypothetical protein DT076_16775 [Desertihabitans brevis]|uniref:Uncharacterized protein n=1 Tax=Desertihabitans brevis TaxID=2268447 RepID=A0A367YTJ4_9ACTN|nr:hypothetical protein [Desertihabitans brevis]RCK68301.1 hypothetical protein DT076_16775 [Desertihabitans brevis]
MNNDDRTTLTYETLARLREALAEPQWHNPLGRDQMAALLAAAERLRELEAGDQQRVCEWCGAPARGDAWHNDGRLHPSCGEPDHGQGWVPGSSIERHRAEAAERDLSEAEEGAQSLLRSYEAERAERKAREADLAKARAALARVQGIASGNATAARARGAGEEERRWLDALAVLDQATRPGSAPAGAAEAGEPGE